MRSPGVGIGGYISGVIVFVDANENGVWDDGEATAVTDATGNFVLTNVVGPLVLSGGVDISAGLVFFGTLRALAKNGCISESCRGPTYFQHSTSTVKPLANSATVVMAIGILALAIR